MILLWVSWDGKYIFLLLRSCFVFVTSPTAKQDKHRSETDYRYLESKTHLQRSNLYYSGFLAVIML